MEKIDHDTWDGETPTEKANRILRLNDYANAVTACQIAFERLNELSGRDPTGYKEENKP